MKAVKPLIRGLVALSATAWLMAGCASGNGESPSGDLVAIGAGLQGVAGLRATILTHGPAHVSAFTIDGAGRLWLSTAAATDTGTDGVYVVAHPGATPVEVVAGLHTPLGLLWIGPELYVASRERVDAYGDLVATTFATHRRVVSFPAGVGELNGLLRAPDGRIQLAISAPCDHCRTTSPYSAAVVSFRPDGSDLRVDVSHLRAPVGLAYVPHTDAVLATVDQRDDLGAATPGDLLIQLVRGQNWRFPDCYSQRGSACDGVDDPVATLDPHAGVDGLAVATGQLGSTVGTAAIVAEYAQGKVQRVPLVANPTGSGYHGTAAPFLTGIKNPVPVLLGPGGHLFLGDWTTGIIYQITPA